MEEWLEGCDCVLELMDRCVEKLLICPGGELWEDSGHIRTLTCLGVWFAKL